MDLRPMLRPETDKEELDDLSLMHKSHRLRHLESGF